MLQPCKENQSYTTLKRFQFMLDRQYPATPSALSGHWRYPCFNENWKRSRPLVVAMRTASRRNSSVYLFAILYLLHSKHCSKETGTKPRQDHIDCLFNFPGEKACRTLGQHRSTQRKVPIGLPDEERLTEDFIELAREFGRYALPGRRLRRNLPRGATA